MKPTICFQPGRRNKTKKYDEVKRLEAQRNVAKSDRELFEEAAKDVNAKNINTIRAQQAETYELGRKIAELQKTIEQREQQRQTSNQA